MAPAWASASSWITPGRTGLPGKWPARNASSPVTRYRADTDSPGSMAATESTNRNGGRCGSSPTQSVLVTVRSRRAAGHVQRPALRLALERGPLGARPAGGHLVPEHVEHGALEVVDDQLADGLQHQPERRHQPFGLLLLPDARRRERLPRVAQEEVDCSMGDSVDRLELHPGDLHELL